ncbi:MAG: NADH-quinone oxidoreductase subunit K [Acidimicrobiales bacterium]|nr:NADH-quinone oxidoreductase subunit K [Acidimicrobiales bacterium]
MIVSLAVAAAVLFATGTYLLLQRQLSRIILGLALLGHGSVVALLVAGGRTGDPPLVDGEPTGTYSDPLVQAMALTAIVITFAVIVFLLALASRSWELTGDDAVEDDTEDRRVAALTGIEELEETFEPAADEREGLDDDADAAPDDAPGSALDPAGGAVAP